MQSIEQVLPPFASNQHKSIFDSKTFWGAVSTAVTAISPLVKDMVKDFLKTGIISPFTILRILLLVGTTTLAIVGRVTADTPVYTPEGLPGPNKTDFIDSKSIFESKTFWGAVSTALVAILPTISDFLSEYHKTGKINIDNITEIAIVLASTTVTIIGRVVAENPVYTPVGLPGPDKPNS
ncbi:MAG: hypothetical protein KME64_03515 [Scytonematopsis contorta HA4267-MV1]|jgi:uncharacterized membrane protein|nr:hypothetical protein [Scytonematopsis contorta HA4267-MV1]